MAGRPGIHPVFVAVNRMTLLPWDYGVRNLLRRPLRTALTALGLALVVVLMLLVVAFVRGLDHSLRRSGDPDVILIHNANAAENIDNSSVSDEVAVVARAEFAPHLMHFAGQAAVSPELSLAVRVGLPDSEASRLGVLRGVDWSRVFLVRRSVQLVEGRLPRRDELIVGQLAAAKLGLPPEALRPGQQLLIEGRPWTVAGRFAAAGALFDAEIWCGLDDLKPAVKRPNDVSIVALRLDPRGDRVRQDGAVDYFCRHRRPDLELMGSREAEYYATLRQHYSHIRALVWLIVVMVGLAGACGAVNTMYAAVNARVREFAALQAVGFSRRAIALSLVQESLLLSAAATLAATALALALFNGSAVRFTMGAFTLHLDRPTLAAGCLAGLACGLFGAIPPTIRALRMPVSDALKAV